MDKRKRNKKQDINILAYNIVQEITEENPPDLSTSKNPHAVALGRLGGLKGGPARAKRLSKQKRKEIARKAALARWEK
jgi:hypothetical protein